MSSKEIIAKRLRIALALKGVLQKELAKEIGVTENTISYFCSEKSERNPTTKQLIKLSKYLKVSTDFLLGLSDEPYTPTVKDTVQGHFQTVIEKAVATYGVDSQLNMATEELAELIQAINKYRRLGSEKSVEDLKSEMADVHIMLEQLKAIFGDCNSQLIYKVERLERRLSEASNDNHS